MRINKAGKITLILLGVMVALVVMCRLAGSASQAAPKRTAYTGLSIINKEIEKHDDYVYITGEIKNGSDNTYNRFKVYGYVYNESGSQIGSDYSYSDSSSLPPGAITTFSVLIDCNGRQVTRYKVSLTDD